MNLLQTHILTELVSHKNVELLVNGLRESSLLPLGMAYVIALTLESG